MKSVDLIKLIVATKSYTVHLYPARRAARLRTPRHSVPSGGGPTKACLARRCAAGHTVPGAASGAQQPGPSAGPSADATQPRAVWRRAG